MVEIMAQHMAALSEAPLQEPQVARIWEMIYNYPSMSRKEFWQAWTDLKNVYARLRPSLSIDHRQAMAFWRGLGRKLVIKKFFTGIRRIYEVYNHFETKRLKHQ
jgi:hypothetical protein